MIEMDSTNTRSKTVPMNILEAADGFRPRALIVAKPKIAITAEGPVTTVNIIVNIISVFISLSY